MQTFEAQAPATRCSRRRTEQPHNTQHGGIHDHAAKNQALETTRPRTAREEENTWVSTWTGEQLVEPPQALDEPRHHTAKTVLVRGSRGETDALASSDAGERAQLKPADWVNMQTG